MSDTPAPDKPVGPLKETQRIEIPAVASGVSGVTDVTKTRVIDVVQRSDFEKLVVGDTMISKSNTSREILERMSPTKFRFRTEKDFFGSKKTHSVFRLTPQGDRMNIVELFKLAVGTVVYGDGAGNPPMTIKKILTLSNQPGGNPYGVRLEFEEIADIGPDEIGFIHQIIKKDSTVK